MSDSRHQREWGATPHDSEEERDFSPDHSFAAADGAAAAVVDDAAAAAAVVDDAAAAAAVVDDAASAAAVVDDAAAAGDGAAASVITDAEDWDADAAADAPAGISTADLRARREARIARQACLEIPYYRPPTAHTCKILMRGYEVNGIDESHRQFFQQALNSGIGYSSKEERNLAKAWRVSKTFFFVWGGIHHKMRK